VADADLGRLRDERDALAEENEQLRLELHTARRNAALEGRLRAQAQAEVEVMRTSTSWRVSAPLRVLGPLRTALQGPAATRRSLRARGGVRAVGRTLRRQGLRRTLALARAEARRSTRLAGYADWLESYDALSDADRSAISRSIASMQDPPLISIVMPVHDTDPQVLAQALDSVTGQLYPHWQLCVCDDASPGDAHLRLLTDLAEQDPRVRLVRRVTNGGIARATNDALALATGDYVAFLDHDDVLAPHALFLVATEVIRHPELDVAYSDEDKLDADGQRCDPHFKPAFNADLLLAQNYLNHLTVVRRSLLDRIGGLRTDLDGAQDHDLVLRATAATTAQRVRRIPFVLYSWRQHSGSGTFSATRLAEAAAASRRAVADHLAATGCPEAVVTPSPHVPSWNRVVWPLPDPAPAVTVIIPTRDRLALLRDCVSGLLDRTDYPALRVLIVDNGSSEHETLAYLSAVVADDRVRVLRAPGPFNYSALNNRAVRAADTPLVLLLNNDIVVRERDWLREMVSQVCRPGVGVVGARLLYADERVQHAGVVLGIGGVAGHSHKHAGPHDTGWFGRLVLAHEVSAVTGACLLTSRELFLAVGGLDEVDLRVAFNDIDFCLKVRSRGHRVVYTPYAELYHLESASRGPEESPAQVARFNRESAVMRDRWAGWLRDDPAYSPNLSDVREDFSLASPPRAVRPWTAPER
jgi:O-antigen biosynthesis protein